jgi:hypothetical protein
MRATLAASSLLLFGLSVFFLAALTLLEGVLVGFGPQGERSLTFMLLVLPAGIGAILGVLSLKREEGRAWLAGAGILLNTLFALFHLMIVLLAG